MPKVYVVQEQLRLDITPARKFGTIITVLSPENTSKFSYNHIVDIMYEKLDDIQPDDYLLLTGDPVCIGLITAIAREFPGPNATLRFLKWLPRELDYLPVEISLVE